MRAGDGEVVVLVAWEEVVYGDSGPQDSGEWFALGGMEADLLM